MEEKLKLNGIVKLDAWEMCSKSETAFNTFTFRGDDNYGNLIEVKIFERNMYGDIVKSACQDGKKFKFTIEEIED